MDEGEMKRVPYDDIEFSDDRQYLYNESLFTGIGVELTEEGVLRSEIEFLNGLQHGLARGYFPNGQIELETPYFKGLRHGIEKKWFNNGRLQERNLFERDVLMSSKRWSEEGRLEKEFVRSDDDVLFRLAREEKT